MREHELLFTLDTLDYLARGGRIGRASAWAGGLLNVKPILTIRVGEVVPLKRVRGSQKAFAEFGALLEAGSTDSASLRIGVAHAAAPERLAAVEELVRRVRPSAQLEVATRSAPSSARTRARARSACSGSTTRADRNYAGRGGCPSYSSSVPGIEPFGRAPVGGAAVAAVLFEREEELAAISAFVEDAAHGPVALVIEGEPGIGKTELWSAGVGAARDRGLRLLESTPAGAETQLSFAVLRDLLDAGFAEAAPSLPSRSGTRSRSRCSTRTPARPAPTRTRSRPRRSACCGRSPRRWPSSWRSATPSGSTRPRPPRSRSPSAGLRTHPCPSSWGGGRARHGPTRPFDEAVTGRLPRLLPVGPLGASSIGELVRDRLGIVLPQAVFERVNAASGGNAFYALELARALGRRSDSLDPYGALPVPDTLNGLVRERLDAQPADVREVLAVVAALAEPTLSLVEATAPAGAIDDAVHAGLLVAEGDGLRFAHPLLASAATRGSARARDETCTAASPRS